MAEEQPVKYDYIQQFISECIPDWIKAREEELKKNEETNHHYNPLRSISIKETDHSRILGDLLDPHGSHGKGTFFLEAFLGEIGVYKPHEGEWLVTIETGRIDVLLMRSDPASVVIIENKSNDAVDQRGQLYRYWFQEIYSRYPDLNYELPETAQCFKIVYAPAQSYCHPTDQSLRRPSEMEYAPSKYKSVPLDLTFRFFKRDIAPWLDEMSEKIDSYRLKIFLKMYAEIWRLSYE